MRGHLELMGDDPEERRETQALLLDELGRMSRLVEDLILLARAERPDFLQLETIDVTDLTEDLFAKVKALAERNWSLGEVARAKIVGDRQRITQAMLNLAENAAKYTKEGDTITLGSHLHKQNVKFWVRDTGPGIDPNDQQRIFERFARGSKSCRSEGSGLGLAIVRAIAEAHRGRIELHSRLGIGSTFTIILPLHT
jgi:signal transduction histidine kinase